MLIFNRSREILKSRDAYNDSRSFQITVYDPAFSVPAWIQRGVVYQIFPDRFRDGNAANNPANGRFSYNRAGGAIVRSNQSDWNYTVCDPRSTYTPACANYYGDNFYGGDLQGIIDKIEDGYFDSLGVAVLYLNPIFLSPSNHKYDTADYMTIDPDFGDLTTFQALITAANNHGMKVVLYPSPLHYREIPKLIAKTRATILFGTDTFLRGYARSASPGSLDTIDLVVTGAERVKSLSQQRMPGQHGARSISIPAGHKFPAC